MLACAAYRDNVAHRGDFPTASQYAAVNGQLAAQHLADGCALTAARFYLEPKDSAQFGWTWIGQNSAIDIDGWDRAIAFIPLLDA